MDYKTIGNALQVEGADTHVDRDFVSAQGIEAPENPSRADGIKLFNAIAEKNDLSPLNDPMGYMKLNDNVYDAIHDDYKLKYQRAADMIDNGLMQGGSYAMNSILNKVNSHARKDITPFMPKDMKYSELRFVKASPEIKDTIDDFVAARVRWTYSYGISRSVENSTFDDIKRDMQTAGKKFTNQIEQATSQTAEKPAHLSSKALLTNGHNNTEALTEFAAQLKNPDTIIKEEGAEHATAEFTATNRNTAKFMLDNREYLKEFRFNVIKASGKVTTTWQSQKVDTMFEERQDPKLDMADLEPEATQGLE